VRVEVTTIIEKLDTLAEQGVPMSLLRTNSTPPNDQNRTNPSCAMKFRNIAEFTYEIMYSFAHICLQLLHLQAL